MTSESVDYPQASVGMVIGGVFVFIGGLLLMISFASPYWVESYEGTYSNFKNMGLWEYCFDKFLFPYHQFPKVFHGCHDIYSYEYYVIREWLLPAWLLSVQTFVTLALILSFSSQSLIALIVTRYPLKFVLSYEWLLSGFIFLANVIAGFFLFLSVIIFWTQSSRRDWLMYPNFNHLSWSYYLCGVAFVFHSIAGVIFYSDARKAWDLREEKWNLVRQMHPPQEHNGFI